MRAKPHIPTDPRVCGYCGKAFVVTPATYHSATIWFCSRQCRLNAGRARHNRYEERHIEFNPQIHGVIDPRSADDHAEAEPLFGMTMEQTEKLCTFFAHWFTLPASSQLYAAARLCGLSNQKAAERFGVSKQAVSKSVTLAAKRMPQIAKALADQPPPPPTLACNTTKPATPANLEGYDEDEDRD